MKYFILILLLFGCQAPEEQGELRSSPSASSSESLSPSKWTASFPLILKFGNDFSTEEKTTLTNSATAWNETNDSQIQYFTTQTSNISGRNTLDDFKDSEFGIYKVYDWPEDMPGTALAVTQIFGKKTSNGYIRINHADVLLNYDYFDFSTNDDWGYDLQTVVVHELGHFLGLYHEDTSPDDSVMYPTISRYRNNRAPLDSDERELSRKYTGVSSRNLLSIKSNETSLTQEVEEDVVFVMELHKDGTEIIKRSK